MQGLLSAQGPQELFQWGFQGMPRGLPLSLHVLP